MASLVLRKATIRAASVSLRRSTTASAASGLRTLAAGPSSTRSPIKAAPVAFTRSLNTSATGSHVDGVDVPEDANESFSIQLQEDSFHGYKLDVPENSVSVTKAELIGLYSKMVEMRRMEMSADKLYKEKLIRGFCHLAIGQEAVSVGMESAINADDKVIGAYRCHCIAVLRGGTVKGVIAELLGRKDGMSHGKGGSMHIFTKSFFGGHGIVGAQVPIGAGIALAQQYMGNDDKHTTLIMYGDGASNQGQIFEAYNMSKLWNVPAVFICENNKYGMGTSSERSSSNTKYYTRGDHIPGLQVNAMDVLAVKAAIKFAKEWTTSGKGPLLVEMVTYRYGGHSMSDPGTTYRSREEIQQMRSNNDPITGLKQRLLDWKIITEDELKKIDKEVRASVEKAVEEAKKSPEPEPGDEMWKDIYFAGTSPPWMRGREAGEIYHYPPEETKGVPLREVKSISQLGSKGETDELGRMV